MEDNPFTPTFGTVPPYMAGRDEVIEELTLALDKGAGDPNLTTIVSGARGTGKTALLSLLASEAEARGWVAVNVSALPGMLEEIVQQAWKAAEHLATPNSKVKVSGIRVADVAEIQFQKETQSVPTWRLRMAEIFEALDATETGLLITVDEVREDLDEMVQLASAFQHFVREGRKAALFMAGLPSHVSALLQNKSVSFLRRANFHEIGSVDDFEVELALRKTIEGAGRSVDNDALSRAVEVTAGFPYMMQLIGYRAWNASPEDTTVSLDDVDAGVCDAKRDLRRKIFDTTFQELSKGDVKFLRAMIEDPGPSTLADIAQRMGKKSNYASEYKRRLIEQGVIADCGQGYLRIEIPFFKEYLKDRLSFMTD